jgi:hypothetical protein
MPRVSASPRAGSLLADLTADLRATPGAATTVAVAIAALVTALGHFTPAQSAAIASSAIALGTVTAAVLAGTVDQATVAGVAGIVATDLALLNVHLAPGQSAALIAASGVVLGGFMHLLSARTTPPVPQPAAGELFRFPEPPGMLMPSTSSGYQPVPPPVRVHSPAEGRPDSVPP